MSEMIEEFMCPRSVKMVGRKSETVYKVTEMGSIKTRSRIEWSPKQDQRTHGGVDRLPEWFRHFYISIGPRISSITTLTTRKSNNIDSHVTKKLIY